ncbi:hypothetical protein Dda_7371 [Drechslerella dactyloides]|uniref:Uncharacterized protein n=1 Tax=Drechslerella dactyloides TaxID=74499 RepID=A0AAD6ISI0_DREDA|nr:hypothetical protein Dda_7371 [Drechslerella dactyloides]
MRFTLLLFVAAAASVSAAPIIHTPPIIPEELGGLARRGADCAEDNAGFEVTKGLPRRPIKEPPLHRREDCKRADAAPKPVRRPIKEPPL